MDAPQILIAKQVIAANSINSDSLRMLAAVLGVRYREELNGDFAHSSVITVVDSEGEIRHQQAGVRKDPAEIAAVLAELLSRAK